MRDIWDLQKVMDEKMDSIQKDINNLKVKLFVKTTSVSVAVSLMSGALVILIYEFIHHLSK